LAYKISPNPKTVRKLQYPSGTVHQKQRILTSQRMDLNGSTQVATWPHVTFTMRDQLLKPRAHQAMALWKIPQIGLLPQHTPALCFRPIFFVLHPSKNSGNVKWNKRPQLFIQSTESYNKMWTTCNLWHNLINGFIITFERAGRDGGVRKSKVGGSLESCATWDFWKLVLQYHGHLITLVQICLENYIQKVFVLIINTKIKWLFSTLQDRSFGLETSQRKCLFFPVIKISELIILNKNRDRISHSSRVYIHMLQQSKHQWLSGLALWFWYQGRAKGVVKLKLSIISSSNHHIFLFSSP